MIDRDFVERLWHRMWWAWIVYLTAAPLIVAVNFAGSSASGKAFQWIQISLAVGMMLFATAIMWLARKWFNFIAGEEICRWRRRP